MYYSRIDEGRMALQKQDFLNPWSPMSMGTIELP